MVFGSFVSDTITRINILSPMAKPVGSAIVGLYVLSLNSTPLVANISPASPKSPSLFVSMKILAYLELLVLSQLFTRRNKGFDPQI